MTASGVTSVASRADDERHADLAQAFVGDADHRGLLDVGVAEEGVLDLGRVGVEAADDEHVLDPPDDPEASAVIDDTEVAGPQPPVGGERVGGRLRIVEIARHHRGAPQHDLAGLAGGDVVALVVDDAELEAGPGPAHRRGHRLVFERRREFFPYRLFRPDSEPLPARLVPVCPMPRRCQL